MHFVCTKLKNVTLMASGRDSLCPGVFGEQICSDFLHNYTCQAWRAEQRLFFHLVSRCRRGLRPRPDILAVLCNRLPTAKVLHDARDQKAIYSLRKVIISSWAECQFPARHVTVICQVVWASPGWPWWHNWRGYSQWLVTSPPLNSFDLCVMSW